jgi:hypothetical protein
MRIPHETGRERESRKSTRESTSRDAERLTTGPTLHTLGTYCTPMHTSCCTLERSHQATLATERATLTERERGASVNSLVFETPSLLSIKVLVLYSTVGSILAILNKSSTSGPSMPKQEAISPHSNLTPLSQHQYHLHHFNNRISIGGSYFVVDPNINNERRKVVLISAVFPDFLGSEARASGPVRDNLLL